MEWLRRNSEQYKGLWVALDGNRLVAASEDAEQVYRAAKCEGSGVPFVVHIHPESDLPFMGGW
ncbi:MAG: DUF5678 domain-containing protein [Bryobacteraceae bacterium]|nr:DUF5678 domain-containing protein [Bryobacteraceae bacterium]